MQILHISSSLDDGGAEAILHTLLTADSENRHMVVSLKSAGKYGPMLERAGIEVHALDMGRNRVTVAGLRSLRKILKTRQPDLVQTWMYHADFLGGLAARLSGFKNVVWGIHNSTLIASRTPKATYLTATACALLSHFIPRQIISCSHRAAEVHIKRGYAKTKMQVIPNGYDTSKFEPDAASRTSIRQELNIDPDTYLVGTVARWGEQKDQPNLIRALETFSQQTDKPWHCLFIGTEMDESNQALQGYLSDTVYPGHISLIGQRPDIPAIMNALDVHILPSAFGEAFPNVVAEAMSCGTPCIVTDVGDSAFMVSDSGWVVPPSDPDALSAAIKQALDARQQTVWSERQTQCRKRVEENFSRETMLDSYRSLWRKVVGRGA